MHTALELIQKATLQTPFEGRLFLVGGAVRDQLLGLPTQNDFDIVTELDSDELTRFLYTTGIGCSAPATFERFGTSMILLEGAQVEFVTARKESYDPTSRKPAVKRGTLLEDAQRRDFTCNALMQNLHTGETLDLLGIGRTDLEKRVLRTPLDPGQTFCDDPLRILRAVRLRWKLGFGYAPGLQEAMRAGSDRLRILSGERVRDELAKMLTHSTAADAMAEFVSLGLHSFWIPELGAMIGVEQGHFHHLDVWEHTLLAIRNANSTDLLLNLAVLLHDVGKPVTRTIDPEGRTRFFGHEKVGADMSREILRRLRFSGEEISTVALLVSNHMRLVNPEKISKPAGRRIIRDLGDELDRFLRLVEADAGALRPGVKQIDVPGIRAHLTAIQRETPKNTLVSPLSGDEIMKALNLEEGRTIGKFKAWLEEQVLNGQLAAGDKDHAREMLVQYAKSAEPETCL